MQNHDVNDDGLYYPVFPNDWHRSKLYKLANWVNGIAFKDVNFDEDGLPVIKIAEIKNGLTDQTKYTKQLFDQSVLVTAGDLLFAWSGQPETSIDANWWRGSNGWLNQHIFRVSVTSVIDVVFFYYILKYLKPNFIGIARNKQTTGLGHVTKRDLERIEVAYPPLPEQRRIAHILGTLDDKIENNRKTAKTLEAMAQAIFQSWFVDFDPVRAKMAGEPPESICKRLKLTPEILDLFPDRLVDSELGEIPEGWEVKPLESVANFLNGLAMQKFPSRGPEDTLPVIKIAQLRSGSLVGADHSSRDIEPQYIVHDGDILFSWSGSLECVLWSGGTGALNQHLFKVTPKATYPRWIVYFGIHHHLSYFREIAAGKATTMGHIQRHHLSDTVLTIPSRMNLETISKPVQAMFEAVWKKISEAKKLSDIRDTLLPKLISGEIRTPEAEHLIKETAG